MANKKTILVTGGAGFIGSNLLNILVLKYPHYRFINIDALTSVANLHNVTVTNEVNYAFFQIDIRDRDALVSLFKNEDVTDIIHLAAETHVDVSIDNPQICIETNINGTGNLLALSLQFKINRFLHVSTDEVYGSLSGTDEPFTESSPLAPNSPYSASKASADLLVRSFNKTYELDTITTRCSNNYGPRQDATKFIPVAITALLNNKKIPIYGKGENVRDWLHVEDHVSAIDIAFHKGKTGETYNVGGGTEKKNIEIAKLLSQYAEAKDTIDYVEDRKGHDFRYAIEDKKIRALGYTPLIQFENGLRNTFEWYHSKLG